MAKADGCMNAVLVCEDNAEMKRVSKWLVDSGITEHLMVDNGNSGKSVIRISRLYSKTQDVLWYLREMCEAVETLAKQHGYKTPQCLPYAKDCIERNN